MDLSATAATSSGRPTRVVSPLRLIASLMVVLFLAEALVMFTLPRFFHTEIDFVDNFADSVLLVLISAPFLWFLVARPLHSSAREVERLNVALSERAAELQQQNSQLQQTYAELQAETAARQQAMEELREKQQLLIQQSRMAAMGEMLGNIAHQWRQPLNVVGVKVQEIGFAHRHGTLDKGLLTANIAAAMGILQHLSQTITVFQDYNAPDKQKSLFSVAQVISDTVQILADSLKDSGINLEVQTAGDPQINGYPHEFGQVLMNLILNAKDALQEHGTGAPGIVVRAWTEADRAIVTISDNGGGISEEIMARVFDPFFTTKPLGKGTGVGLFLSKAIIEKNMGGCISVCNSGDGAVFRIEV